MYIVVIIISMFNSIYIYLLFTDIEFMCHDFLFTLINDDNILGGGFKY